MPDTPKPAVANRIPLMLNVNDRAFEQFFKLLMSDIIQGDTKVASLPSRVKLDEQLRRTLIKGFNKVDFKDTQNQIALQQLLEDMWSELRPLLTRKVKQNSGKFKQTLL